MPPSIWLAAAAIAVSVPLAWWALSGVRVPARAVRTNLSQGIGQVTDLRAIELQRSARDRVVSPTMEAMAGRARRITPTGILETLERRAHLAGLAESWPMERVLATKVMLGLTGAICGGLFFVLGPSVVRLLLWLVFTVALYFVVDVVLDGRARERQEAINRALPDTLDQITVGVEAGLGFEAAVARTCEGPGPLAEELGRTLQDIQIGQPRERALEHLLERTDVQDLRTFVHAFSQAQRYGIPMAQVLRVQSEEMREKRRQRAEERAMKIPVKIVFPVVVCILPALFVAIIGPAVVRIAESGLGG